MLWCKPGASTAYLCCFTPAHGRRSASWLKHLTCTRWAFAPTELLPLRCTFSGATVPVLGCACGLPPLALHVARGTDVRYHPQHGTRGAPSTAGVSPSQSLSDVLPSCALSAQRTEASKESTPDQGARWQSVRAAFASDSCRTAAWPGCHAPCSFLAYSGPQCARCSGPGSAEGCRWCVSCYSTGMLHCKGQKEPAPSPPCRTNSGHEQCRSHSQGNTAADATLATAPLP